MSQRLKYLFKYLYLSPSIFLFSMSSLFADEFMIESLPHGAEVTVPGNTQTILGMQNRVKLSTTENVQTLRFIPIAMNGGVPEPIELAIFDRNQDRVKYVKINPSTPFLYGFKKMSSIYVVPKPSSKTRIASLKLKVESDKPVSVAK